MSVFLHDPPVFLEAHPAVNQKHVPHGGPHQGVEEEGQEGHAGQARGQGDEVANHRNEPGNEDGLAPVALEKLAGPLQVMGIKEEIAPVAVHHRLPQDAQAVRNQGAGDGAQAAGHQHRPGVEVAGEDEKTGKGHHQFAGNGCDHALQGHEHKDPEVAARMDELGIVMTQGFRDSHGRLTFS